MGHYVPGKSMLPVKINRDSLCLDVSGISKSELKQDSRKGWRSSRKGTALLVRQRFPASGRKGRQLNPSESGPKQVPASHGFAGHLILRLIGTKTWRGEPCCGPRRVEAGLFSQTAHSPHLGPWVGWVFFLTVKSPELTWGQLPIGAHKYLMNQ